MPWPSPTRHAKLLSMVMFAAAALRADRSTRLLSLLLGCCVLGCGSQAGTLGPLPGSEGDAAEGTQTGSEGDMDVCTSWVSTEEPFSFAPRWSGEATIDMVCGGRPAGGPLDGTATPRGSLALDPSGAVMAPAPGLPGVCAGRREVAVRFTLDIEELVLAEADGTLQILDQERAGLVAWLAPEDLALAPDAPGVEPFGGAKADAEGEPEVALQVRANFDGAAAFVRLNWSCYECVDAGALIGVAELDLSAD